jgi:agmatine deiminase
MIKTPKELGFTMPAEWEKHSAVWLAWPYDETTFPGLIPNVEKKYCEIINKKLYE